MMGLRLRDGIPLASVEDLLAGDPEADRRRGAIERLCAAGELRRTDDALVIPRERILMTDGIIAELL